MSIADDLLARLKGADSRKRLGQRDGERVLVKTPDALINKHAPIVAEVQEKIVSLITQGAFPHIAARAAGIGPSTFKRWMKDPNYEDFRLAVETAQANARAAAEIHVKIAKPEHWLKVGPGRWKNPETDEQDWVEPAKEVSIRGSVAHVGVGVPQGFDVAKLSDADIDDLLRIHAKATQQQLGPGAIDVTPIEDAVVSGGYEDPAEGDAPSGEGEA